MERGSHENFTFKKENKSSAKKIESKIGIRPKMYLLSAGFLFSILTGSFGALEYVKSKKVGQNQQTAGEVLPENETEEAKALENLYPKEMIRIRQQVDGGTDPQEVALDAKQTLLEKMRKGLNEGEESSTDKKESQKIKAQLFSREIGNACLKKMREISLSKGYNLITETESEVNGGTETNETALVKQGEKSNLDMYDANGQQKTALPGPTLSVRESKTGSLEMNFFREDKINKGISYNRFVEVFPQTDDQGTRFTVRITDDTNVPAPKGEDYIEGSQIVGDRKEKTVVLIRDDEDIDTIDPEEVSDRIIKEYYYDLTR